MCIVTAYFIDALMLEDNLEQISITLWFEKNWNFAYK